MNPLQGYYPYQIPQTSHITPDTPQFHSFALNLVILTKYGKFVFIRHGNEDKCSSFLATLSTVVNKLQLSIGSIDNPAKLKKIVQGKLRFHVLKRRNFVYIFWNKKQYADLRLYSMIDFVHYQLMSCLTAKIDEILEKNQTYDPTINFGKGKSVFNLLQFSVQNGLNSLPMLFNAIPITFLTNQVRTQIYNIINVKQYKEEGLQVSMIITMNSVVSISKRKNIDLEIKDIFLFFNLLQSQSTLSKSQNWFPICLPGIQPECVIFCYINFLSEEIIHIMITDEAEIFPRLSEINKEVKEKLTNGGLLEKIKVGKNTQLKTNPAVEKIVQLKHFVIRNAQFNQMIMSSGHYFGDNTYLNQNFFSYTNVYAQLYEHLLTTKHNRKQKLHVELKNDHSCGYYDEGGILILGVGSTVCDLQEMKNIFSTILKMIKEEENNIFLQKY